MPSLRKRDIGMYGALAQVCSLLAAVIAAVAWLGLKLGAPRLASLGHSLIPMAPSSSLLFILYAGIGFVAARKPTETRSVRIALAVILFCMTIAAALFTLSLQGSYLDIEHLGVISPAKMDHTPVGHMSPITAFSFLAAGVAFLMVLITTPQHHRWAKGSFLIALLLFAAFSMLSLAYLLGTPLFYGDVLIPPAATTSLAFMALGLALFFLSLPIGWPNVVEIGGETRNSSLALIVVFVMLVAGILCAVYFYHHTHEKQHLGAMRSQLSAIADLKLGEITLWRAERLIDASLFHENRAFADIVQSYLLTPPSRRARHDLNVWLASTRANRNYDGIFLFDAHGRNELLLSGQAGVFSPYIAETARTSLQTGRIIFSDFYRSEADGKIYLNIMIPILDPSHKGRGLAVLSFRIDPERYLYPFIKKWPVESATAETLIVRRDGNDALFLNQLRFNKNAALNLRIPLTRSATPAVMAVLGRTGVVEGVDYRGVPVFAALRAIPDSPWYLVARMDSSEVYRPLRERMWVTVMLVFALLVSATTGVGLVWRRRNLSYYKRMERDAKRNRERLQCLVNVLQFQAQSIQDLLDNALSEALSLTGSRYGYICFYNEAKQLVTLNSWSRDMMPDCGVLVPQTGYELESIGFWGEAVRQRKPIMVNDFALPDPLRKGCPDGHVPLTRFLTVPVIDQGEIMAVVGVANKETDFDDADVVQLSLLMDSVWKAVVRKRHEEELQQRNAEMERFTYTVSHDLKSPLVTITAFLGFLEIDIKNNDESRIKKDVGYMRAAADRMGKLLAELLELSRVGRVVTNPVRVNFSDVVQEALRLVAGRISERGVTVTVSENRAMLFGDQARLVEIWQNLVENAVKYMGSQVEPRIEIGTEQQGKETQFFVRDNGLGIDMRYHENIFGLFNKLDANSDGTGLGLALVKRIVELHGGRIWVESDGEGCGSCFRFTLPGAVKGEGCVVPS
ncbi:MAG: GAF domain-containing protein [Desulfuromonadales bacterium]|nr:GAF domain-containing protein [Desulfuromonadales bacterium]